MTLQRINKILLYIGFIFILINPDMIFAQQRGGINHNTPIQQHQQIQRSPVVIIQQPPRIPYFYLTPYRTITYPMLPYNSYVNNQIISGNLKIKTSSKKDLQILLNGNFAGVIKSGKSFKLPIGVYELELKDKNNIIFHQTIQIIQDKTLEIKLP